MTDDTRKKVREILEKWANYVARSETGKKLTAYGEELESDEALASILAIVSEEHKKLRVENADLKDCLYTRDAYIGMLKEEVTAFKTQLSSALEYQRNLEKELKKQSHSAQFRRVEILTAENTLLTKEVKKGMKMALKCERYREALEHISKNGCDVDAAIAYTALGKDPK